jgi:hypothetical protein
LPDSNSSGTGPLLQRGIWTKNERKMERREDKKEKLKEKTE